MGERPWGRRTVSNNPPAHTPMVDTHVYILLHSPLSLLHPPPCSYPEFYTPHTPYTLLIRSYTLPSLLPVSCSFPPLPLLLLHTHTTNRYAKAAEAKEKARSRKYFGYPDPKLAWKGYWALSQMLRRKTFIEECKQEEGDVR